MTDFSMTADDIFRPPENTEEEAKGWISDQAIDKIAELLDTAQEAVVAGIDRFNAGNDKQADDILARREAERNLEQVNRSQNFDLQQKPLAVEAPAEPPALSPAAAPFNAFEQQREDPTQPAPATQKVADTLYNRIDRQKSAADEQKPAPAAKPAVKSVATSSKTGKLTGITVVVVGVIVLGIIVLKVIGGNTDVPEKSTESNTKKLLEGLKSYDQRDIRNMQERRPVAAPQESPLPAANTPAPEEQPSAAPQTAQAPRPKTGKGANYYKDKDIIEQYKEVNPGAAAAEGTAPAANPEGNSLRYRPRPFSAGSTGDNKGGIRITGRDTGPQKTNTIQLHNTQLKARLKFSIRSSASNSITAESNQDIENIPAGSIFYGSGSFSNKRTYVQFNRVRIGETEYDVKAYAISGKDPGIPSEVIEIENNAKITFTSGVMDATGKVLDNLVSSATAGAGSGVVNDTTGEVKDKNEQQRARYEYRVGAGTTFTIYIE